MTAYKRYTYIFHRDFMNLLCFGLIETGIAIYFVEVIDIQTVTRTLVLY